MIKGLIAYALVAQALAATLSVTQINLRWFGRGSESRVESIKRHLEQERLFADVMMFEEIVDKELLQTKVLGTKYACQSYERQNRQHQYIVLCVRSPLQLQKAAASKSYVLNDVDLNGHLRPAVHGVVVRADGTRLLHVVAVHLKAMPAESSTRLQQAKVIKNYLAIRRELSPVFVGGDFNTFSDDADRLGEILQPIGISEFVSEELYTWASATENFPPATFDRVFLSDELHGQVLSQRVVGPCNDATFEDLSLYNQQVSDHCAVHTEIDTP